MNDGVIEANQSTVAPLTPYQFKNFRVSPIQHILLLNDFYAALDNNQILVFIQLHFV